MRQFREGSGKWPSVSRPMAGAAEQRLLGRVEGGGGGGGGRWRRRRLAASLLCGPGRLPEGGGRGGRTEGRALQWRLSARCCSRGENHDHDGRTGDAERDQRRRVPIGAEDPAVKADVQRLGGRRAGKRARAEREREDAAPQLAERGLLPDRHLLPSAGRLDHCDFHAANAVGRRRQGLLSQKKKTGL